MDFSWLTFIFLCVVMIPFSMFSRGLMNAQNVDRFGSEADWKSNPNQAILGSVLGGAIWSAIITFLIGLF